MSARIDRDLELLERWRAGDQSAGAELVDRHFPGVRAFFLNKLPLAHEDLVQETFLQVVKSRDRFRAEGSFRAYLFRISRNVLAQHLRQHYRHVRTFEPARSSIIDLTGRRPSSLMVEREEQQRLLDALQTLPLDDQHLLELCYWQRLSAGELATVLEIPEGTVRSRKHAALERLRRAYRGRRRVLRLGDVTRRLDELRELMSGDAVVVRGASLADAEAREDRMEQLLADGAELGAAGDLAEAALGHGQREGHELEPSVGGE